jgi:hypothetical protein
MKRRYILYRRNRGGMFYIEDTETRKQESTGTRNRAEATTLLNARDESIRQPQLNFQIAKAYLAGTDSGVATLTWQQALMPLSKPRADQLRIAGSGGQRDRVGPYPSSRDFGNPGRASVSVCRSASGVSGAETERRLERSRSVTPAASRRR